MSESFLVGLGSGFLFSTLEKHIQMILSKLPTWQKGALLGITIISVILIATLQISSSETATKTESTLFNVLQFIFSTVFAWLLSAFIGETQQTESQRKFAIGAFRRIKEIERAVNRTQKHVANLEDISDETTKAKIAAVKGGLSSLQDTVRSSIADWSDIIGDEIQITNEMQRIKKMRNESDDSSDDEKGNKNNENINERLSALAKSLPTSIANELEIDEQNDSVDMEEILAHEWSNKSELLLHCFWEADGDFGADLSGMRINDRVFVSRGMTNSRPNTLMLSNAQGEQIAVVTNRYDCTYDEFMEAIESFYGRTLIPKIFGGTPLTAIIVELEEYEHHNLRQYLWVKIEQFPHHHCVVPHIEALIKTQPDIHST